MKVYIMDEETVIRSLSFNEDSKDEKILGKVKKDTYSAKSGTGAMTFHGELKNRDHGRYFSIKEKIIMAIKKIIADILMKFGPKSKLSQQQLGIKNRINQIKSQGANINKALMNKPIELRAVSIFRPTVDIQPSFNEILNKFNSIITNPPDNFEDKHDGFIGTSGGAHRALSSIIKLMCANTEFDKTKSGIDRYKHNTSYTTIRRNVKDRLDDNANNFIFKLYEDQDNVDKYVVSIDTENISFNNVNAIIKFMNDRLIAIKTIVSQINIGNKQLEMLKAKVTSANIGSDAVVNNVNWLVKEYGYFIKGLNIYL